MTDNKEKKCHICDADVGKIIITCAACGMDCCGRCFIVNCGYIYCNVCYKSGRQPKLLNLELDDEPVPMLNADFDGDVMNDHSTNKPTRRWDTDAERKFSKLYGVVRPKLSWQRNKIRKQWKEKDEKGKRSKVRK